MPQAISGACGLNWHDKDVGNGLEPSLTARMLHENTVLNSAMKPAAPPELRATRFLDQVCGRIHLRHYSLRTEL